eukprot:scaffold91487_cov30-Tisochrysis_lutea.AAC.1
MSRWKVLRGISLACIGILAVALGRSGVADHDVGVGVHRDEVAPRLEHLALGREALDRHALDRRTGGAHAEQE